MHKHVIPCQSAALSEGDEDSEEDKENKAPSPSQLALKMKPRQLFVPTDKYWTPSKGIYHLLKGLCVILTRHSATRYQPKVFSSLMEISAI